MGALFTLGRSDILNFRRDTMLQFLLIYPLILGGLLRWLVPWVQSGLMESIGFDLGEYLLLLVSFFGLLIIPQIVGLLVGTLLLDEKDQDTLTALMVTPMPIRTYALYRALTPALISVLGILVVVPFINILVLPFDKLLPLAISAAPLGPMMALLLAALAKNKVEGLAVMKGTGNPSAGAGRCLVRAGALAVAAGRLSHLLGDQRILAGLRRRTLPLGRGLRLRLRQCNRRPASAPLPVWALQVTLRQSLEEMRDLCASMAWDLD